MSAVVVNHLHLTVPVDDLATVVAREFELIFRAQPGFERFYLVKVDRRRGDRRHRVGG